MTERRFVRLEHEGAVSTLTVDRADRLNSLDREVLGELRSALEEMAERTGTRCLIVTGAGKAFVAGADIAAMRDMSPAEAREFAEAGHRTFDMIEALTFPAIAAVNGFALGGGCELALACDFVYASEKAKLGQPEVKLGVIPGFGGTQRLARRVGASRARELIYTGGMVGAEEALRIGIVNAVFAPDELMAETRKTAQAIASMGPLAVARAKRVILDGADNPLTEAKLREVDAFAQCFTTADQGEGMAAFLDKREPRFEGK
jgi:enoyl-CoA hydratase